MELRGKTQGLRIEEPLEQMAQDLVEAQAPVVKTARQRFPALPQWMFTGAWQLGCFARVEASGGRA